MLKKISWVIAALFVASAMIFIGCPTEMGGMDDGTAPRQAEDLVLEGEDIILKACGSSQSKVVIDGTKVTLDGNNTGFYFDFPEAAAEYAEVQVFFEIVEVMAGTGPGLLIKKNTKFENPVGISSDQDPAYQLNNVGPAGTKFDTGVWKTNRFDKQMAFQNQIYNPAGNSASKFTVEVLKIVFPGGGEPPVELLPPTFGGGAGKVVYAKDATTLVETVTDSDPLITGAFGMAVSSDGFFTFDKSGRINYKFPASATGATALDLEKDWDYIKVEYIVKNVVKGKDKDGVEVDTAVQAKTQFTQYDTNTGYDLVPNGNFQSLSLVEAGGNITIQTWGSNGSGGFSLRLNDWDLVTGGGNENSCADKFDVKITKVTFTKGTRYKVSLFSPATGFAPPTFEVLDGNGLRSDLVAPPAYRGWTFYGWYGKYDGLGLVIPGATPSANRLVSNPSETNIGNVTGIKVTNGLPVIDKGNKTFFLDGQNNTMQSAATGGTDLFGATTDLTLGVIIGYGKAANGTDNITKTAIVIDGTKGLKVYGYWFTQQLDPIVITVGDDSAGNLALGGVAAANGTLFKAIGSYANAGADATGVGGTASSVAGTTYTYDGKLWWIIADAHSGNYTWDKKDENFPQVNFDAVKAQQANSGNSAPGYTRINFAVPAEAMVYDKATITYDAIAVGGENPKNVELRNNTDGASGSNYAWPDLSGTNQTFTVTSANFSSGGISIVKNNHGAFLLRITKIEFSFDN